MGIPKCLPALKIYVVVTRLLLIFALLTDFVECFLPILTAFCFEFKMQIEEEKSTPTKP